MIEIKGYRATPAIVESMLLVDPQLVQVCGVEEDPHITYDVCIQPDSLERAAGQSVVGTIW